jgi:outer membrane protein assembly factor BamB
MPSSDGTIYALQKDNAKVLWKFELDHGVPTHLVVTDRYLIVGSSFQYLYVIDKNTGVGVYRFNAGYDSGFAGSPAYDPATGWLFALSGSGNLYSFELRKPPRKAFPHAVGDAYVDTAY